MSNEFIYVTGNLDVGDPGKAKKVMRAFDKACKGHSQTTLYVLGNLFHPSVDLDAMERYMAALPGRKVLIPGSLCITAEQALPYWHDVWDEPITLTLWGRRITLGADASTQEPGSLLVHASRLAAPDTGEMVNASWDHWNEDPEPHGLKSLYELLILSDQIGAGFVCAESRERG